MIIQLQVRAALTKVYVILVTLFYTGLFGERHVSSRKFKLHVSVFVFMQ